MTAVATPLHNFNHFNTRGDFQKAQS